MLENLDKPVAQLDTLTTAEIRTIQDQLAAAEERQKKRKDAFAALMERRFGDAARQAYKDEGKDTGTVRATPGGSNLLELKAEIDKTVVWDQDGLLKLLNGMKPADAKHYGKIKVEVPEAKFTGAPPDVQAQLKPLRTVKPGKMKLALVDRKLEAEAA